MLMQSHPCNSSCCIHSHVCAMFHDALCQYCALHGYLCALYGYVINHCITTHACGLFEQVSTLTCLPWCAGQGTDPSKPTPAPPKPTPAPGTSPTEDWRQPVPIDMKFGVGMKIRARHKRPATASLWGRFIFAVYIGSFLFYAYCRVAHTMDQQNSAFAYQVRSWRLYAYNNPAWDEACVGRGMLAQLSNLLLLQ